MGVYDSITFNNLFYYLILIKLFKVFIRVSSSSDYNNNNNNNNNINYKFYNKYSIKPQIVNINKQTKYK